MDDEVKLNVSTNFYTQSTFKRPRQGRWLLHPFALVSWRLAQTGPPSIVVDAALLKHSRGAPYHPQTQGKIERWHQTLKNRILLEHYFLPGDIEAQIEAFVDHYNHQRYHESLNNVTPSDVYFGRDKAILKQMERIKRKTLEARRLHHRQRAA
jgi:putative transposase